MPGATRGCIVLAALSGSDCRYKEELSSFEVRFVPASARIRLPIVFTCVLYYHDPRFTAI